jgi:hypothetical protein
MFIDKESSIIILPPDEYNNGRILIEKKLLNKILSKNEILIPEICNKKLFIKNSLTQVVP